MQIGIESQRRFELGDGLWEPLLLLAQGAEVVVRCRRFGILGDRSQQAAFRARELSAHQFEYGEIAASLGRAFGVRTRRIPVPDLVLDLAGVLVDEFASLVGATPIFGRQKARELKVRWWLCSARRAEREIGWRPRVTLDEGMAATARWYVEAGKVRVPAGARGSL